MAKIKITGRDWVTINEELAQKIKEMKLEKCDPEHLVDLRDNGFVALGQIKQILLEGETQGEKELSEQRFRERQTAMLEWSDYVNRCRQEGVEQKAMRMVRSWCALLWTARGNKPIMNMPEELKDELMLRLLDYFEKNPNEWHAEQNIYKDLIPFGKVAVISEVKGAVSLGQAMQQKLGV